MVSPTEASSDDSEQEEVPKVLPPEAWRPCPDPKVFKDLLLEWRCLEEADTVEDDEEEARHGVGERSFVRLFVEPQPSEHCLSAPLGAVEFFLGEESGHQCIQEESSDTRPPQELNRLDIPRWLTEAALCLRFAGTRGRFRSREGSPDLIGEHHVRLIAVQRGADLLGDGAILLRQLRVGSGPRPIDAATVRASWRAWFQRNLELIFSTGDPENPAEAVEVVIDEDEVMAALQLGLKHLKAGSRGFLRVSADWGLGQLLPSGGPSLRSAAVWIDICMHEVQNPPLPGELQDPQSCLDFVEHRKVQGNGHLASGDAASIARATRRYEEGIAALAGLKEAPASAAALLAALRRNLALAHLRRGRWADAESVCSAVLQEGLDSKAFFRRGAARLGLDDFDGAVEDLREALGLASETEVPAVRRELAKAQARRKEWQQGQRKAFKGVFDKMTLQDEEREKRQKEAEEKAKEEEARLLREQEREKESLATPEVAETQQEEDNINAKVSAMVEPTASGAVEPEHEEAADFRNVTLLKRPQETGITALMPPPGARISQAPPKVENYQVPSFLRKKQQKKS